ncbi:MAG: LTA synthase family protein [Prevotella sp.]
MARKYLYLLLHFTAMLCVFLFVQKVLFFLYNWNCGGSACKASDIVRIYYHGFALDAATAAYLTMPALVVLGLSIFWQKLNVVKSLKAANLLIAILVALTTVADASLYEFWTFKLDATAFMYITDPKNAFASVSFAYLLVRLLAIVFLSWFFYFILNRAILMTQMKGNKQRKWLACLCWLLAAGILFAVARGVRIWPNTPGRVYYSKEAFHNHTALNPLFNVMYSLTHTERFAEEFRFFGEDERKQVFDGLFPTEGKTTMSVLRESRPNILFIVLEGFGALFVENLGGMKDIAPNIDRISRQSVNFKRCYCSSFRTDRGIVSAISGYLGQPTTSIMRFTHKIQTLPGLPKTLKKYGYSTQVLYASDITFFNMSDYFIASGHDRLVSQDDFPASQRTCKWGVPDHIAFEWLYNDITENHKSDSNPWYITFLTISSHTPFDVPYNRLKDEKLNSFAYTDECFGKFIDKLRKTEAWNNLLIIVSADHGFNHREIATADFPHIPFFLTGGAAIEPCEINTLLSQTDIPATILGQMGIDHKDFIFSRDVLANTYTYPFAFNTFNNGFNFRDSTGCIVYDNVARRALEGADLRKERIGKAILQTLYQDLDKR